MRMFLSSVEEVVLSHVEGEISSHIKEEFLSHVRNEIPFQVQDDVCLMSKRRFRPMYSCTLVAQEVHEEVSISGKTFLAYI